MNQECFSGVHLSMYVPIGIFCAIFICLLPPLAAIWLVVRKLHKLNDGYVEQMYGFLYHKYK